MLLSARRQAEEAARVLDEWRMNTRNMLDAVNFECVTAGVFNAWPAELFAVARRPFWKNNYKSD